MFSLTNVLPFTTGIQPLHVFLLSPWSCFGRQTIFRVALKHYLLCSLFSCMCAHLPFLNLLSVKVIKLLWLWSTIECSLWWLSINDMLENCHTLALYCLKLLRIPRGICSSTTKKMNHRVFSPFFHNITQLMRCVHGPNSRFESKDFGC